MSTYAETEGGAVLSIEVAGVGAGPPIEGASTMFFVGTEVWERRGVGLRRSGVGGGRGGVREGVGLRGGRGGV